MVNVILLAERESGCSGETAKAIVQDLLGKYAAWSSSRRSSADGGTSTIIPASAQISIRVMMPGSLRLLALLEQPRMNPTVFGVISENSNTSSSSSWTCAMEVCLEGHCVWPHLILSSNIKDVPSSALRLAKSCGLVSPTIQKSISSVLEKRQQASYVEDAQAKTQSPQYMSQIYQTYDTGTQVTGDKIVVVLPNAKEVKRIRGKVRDRYELQDQNRVALVTTDRQSGFDRMLALVPYKGQVLNLTSAWWFQQTQHIISNHLITVPHPNVSIVKKCQPFPIEFVVRAYMTGSTNTSIWKNYQNGIRRYCGHDLPEGMTKNQKLHKVILTPTTKEEKHDRPISPEEIISEGWMSRTDFDVCAKAALEVFRFGQKVAKRHGLILVDTKYEMGKDIDTGTILMIDEMHTPDSSRYWLASTYEDQIVAGAEPENIDKEFLRLWFRDHCDPYTDTEIPKAPRELVTELSRRYISLYEMITGQEFEFHDDDEDQIGCAIADNSS